MKYEVIVIIVVQCTHITNRKFIQLKDWNIDGAIVHTLVVYRMETYMRVVNV